MMQHAWGLSFRMTCVTLHAGSVYVSTRVCICAVGLIYFPRSGVDANFMVYCSVTDSHGHGHGHGHGHSHGHGHGHGDSVPFIGS